MGAHRLETLREQVALLEKEVKALQRKVDKKASDRAEAIAKEQAKFFLVKFFIPFFEGVCDVQGISIEQAISELIDENKTLDKIFEENMDKTSSLMGSPEFRVVVTTVRPSEDKSDEWIVNHSRIVLEVMEDIRPGLAEVVYKTENGRKWFADSLIGVRNMLFKIS